MRGSTDGQESSNPIAGSQQYQAIVEQIVEMVFLTDDQGTITYVSPASERLFGYPPYSMKGRPFTDFLDEVSVHTAMEAFRSTVTAGSETESIRLRMRHQNGEIFTGELSARPFQEAEQRGTMGVIRDVTEQDRKYELLLDTQANLHALIDNTDGIIWSVDSELRFIIGNSAFSELIRAARGAPFEEGEQVLSEEFESVNSMWRKLYERALSGESFYHEMNLQFSDSGQAMILHFSPIRDQSESICGVTVFGRDVTKLRQYEKDLRANSALLSSIAANYPDAYVSIVEEDRTIGFTSGQEFVKQGLGPKQFEGLRLEQVFGEHAPMVRRHYDLAFKGEEQEFELQIADQFQRYRAVPLQEEDGSIKRILAVAQNITKRKLSEYALVESEKRFRALFENVNEAVALHEAVRDENGRICDFTFLDCNPMYEQLTKLSRSDIIGKRVLEVIPNLEQRWIDAYAQVVDTQQPQIIIGHSDYLDRHWEVNAYSASPGQLAVAFTDITHRIVSERNLREQEERYRLMFHNAPLGYQSLDARGHILEVNDVWLEILGYERSGVIGRWFGDFLHSDQQEIFRERLAINIESHDVIRDVNFSLRKSDGSYIDARYTARIGFDAQGSFQQTHCVFEDITESKRAAEALARSEERYRLIDDSSVDYVYSYDVGGRFTHASKSLCAALQLPADKILGKTHAELGFPEEQCKEWDGLHNQVYETDTTIRVETSTPMPDGMVRNYEVTLNPLHNSSGIIVGIAGMTRDITERKAAERAQKESEELYRLLATNTTDVIWTANLSGQFTYVSPSVLQLRGYTAEEVMQAPFSAAVTSESMEVVARSLAELHEVMDKGEPLADKKILQLEQPCKDGSTVWTETVTSTIRSEDGSLLGILGVSRDITERKAAEAVIIKSEAALVKAQEIAKVGSWDYSIEENRTTWSREMFRIFGRAYELEELSWAEHQNYIHPDDWDRINHAVQRAVKEGVEYREEFRLVHPDGQILWAETIGYAVRDASGSVVHLSGTVQDITLRKRVEEEKLVIEGQLRQSQKLESIGTLASGVAHEINNPLMGMMNYAELVKDSVPGDSRASELLDGILDEGKRIAMIVKNLLSFARQDASKHSPARVFDIVSRTLSLLEASMRKNQITLQVDVAEDLPLIPCRSQQIQQVIINLISNAQDALNARYPEYHENKILSIVASTLRDDSGEWLRVTVKDHGTGIPREIQPRIYDPFFTSKSRDQGTGLGLSVSHGIVKDHSGRMSFETQESEFTRFHIDLPLPRSSASDGETR